LIKKARFEYCKLKQSVGGHKKDIAEERRERKRVEVKLKHEKEELGSEGATREGRARGEVGLEG